MAYKSGFFDAAELDEGVYDRIYQAADFAHYFALLVGNGVFYLPEDSLKVFSEDTASMSVYVSSGSGWIKGYYLTVEDGDEEHLSVSVAHASYSRIDSVILGLNLNDRAMNLYIKKGTASSSPTAVSLQRDSSVWELELARITIPAGASSIQQSYITDMRADDSRCGYVRSLVEKETGYLDNFLTKQVYDPDGVVAAAGGMAKYAIPQSQIGSASGVAPLDTNKKVPIANLPVSDSTALNSSNSLASSAAVKKAYDSTPLVVKISGSKSSVSSDDIIAAVTSGRPVYIYSSGDPMLFYQLDRYWRYNTDKVEVFSIYDTGSGNWRIYVISISGTTVTQGASYAIETTKV